MKRQPLVLMTMVVALILSSVGMAAAQTGLPSGQTGVLDSDTLDVTVEDVYAVAADWADGSPFCIPPYGVDWELELTNNGTAPVNFAVQARLLDTGPATATGFEVAPGTSEFQPSFYEHFGNPDTQGATHEIIVRAGGVPFTSSSNPEDWGTIIFQQTIDPEDYCAPDVNIQFVNADASPVDVGEDYGFSVQLTNAGSMVENAIVGVEVSRTAGIVGGDLTLEYLDGTDWLPLTFQEEGGVLYLYFGPTGGFEVGNGYDVTTQFRANFDVADVFTGTVYAIDLDA